MEKYRGSLIALGALLFAPPLEAATYVDDPLTSPTYAGRANMGGTFDANGWTTTGDTDALWYDIPDTLDSGSVTYSVTGLGYANGGPLNGGDHDIFCMYEPPSGVAEPIGYDPYFRDNDFKVFTRIFGAQDPGPGRTKLQMFRCPRGDPWYHAVQCDAGCGNDNFVYANGGNDPGWDAAHTYAMGLSWGPGTMTFTRDGQVFSDVSYDGLYAPITLRVRLGSPKHISGSPSIMPVGVTFKDFTVDGTPGSATPVCGPTGSGGSSGSGGSTSVGGSPDMGMEIAPIADVTAASWEPAVFSDPTDLNIEGDGTSPTAVVYVRFPLPSGPVSSAVLRMRTHAYDSAAGMCGLVYAVTDDTWSETTMTWATRPPTSGAPAGTSMMVSPDTFVGWDVTSFVAAGFHSFAVVSTDADGAHFRSKEEPTGDGPKLVVSLAPEGAGGSGGSTTTGAGGQGTSGATSSVGGAAGKGTAGAPNGTGGSSGGKSGSPGTAGMSGSHASGAGGVAPGGSSGEGGTTLVHSPSDTATGDDGSGGCGCRGAGGGERSAGALSLAVVAVALGVRRRRRKSAPREHCPKRVERAG